MERKNSRYLGMNYNGRRFKVLEVSENGEVGTDMIFTYNQEGNVLYCQYEGVQIRRGQLLGVVDGQGNIDMRYHQILMDGSIQTGICHSTPERTANGKLLLHEKWQWTSGDLSNGTSTLEEI